MQPLPFGAYIWTARNKKIWRGKDFHPRFVNQRVITVLHHWEQDSLSGNNRTFNMVGHVYMGERGPVYKGKVAILLRSLKAQGLANLQLQNVIIEM
ncbi:hypothetical protein VNO78_31687 [Psophocarpus tetragonolobus]|uniref:Uncharacterized protein n=1 Tax=Psophocarpus tetragonolobus TaxID=3891 RepID=A0AAN9RYJ1_PSOTE